MPGWMQPEDKAGCLRHNNKAGWRYVRVRRKAYLIYTSTTTPASIYNVVKSVGGYLLGILSYLSDSLLKA
jgi:hypothetical protein